MEADDLPALFIEEIKAYSESAHYERNAFSLSEALGIRIRPGLYTSVIPGPPPTIILEPDLLQQPDSDHVRHEISHVIMWWSGIEQALHEEYGASAPAYIERLCHAAVGFLRAPQNLVDHAVMRFGVSAEAVLYLRRETGMPLRSALQRLVYDDSEAARAGYILTSKHVSEVATCNFRLPFWLYDRVPEPLMLFPADVSSTLCRVPGTSSALGICSARM